MIGHSLELAPFRDRIIHIQLHASPYSFAPNRPSLCQKSFPESISTKNTGPMPNGSAYTPSCHTLTATSAGCGSHVNYRISRMSSKYIVPVPPAAGLFLVPMPMVMALTLVRFTPANAVRSITHSFHPESWVATGSS